MNLKVRLKNKTFWVACAGLLILVIQYIQGFISIDLNLPLIEKIFEAFVLCAVILGVIIDPTTPNIKDAEKRGH